MILTEIHPQGPYHAILKRDPLKPERYAVFVTDPSGQERGFEVLGKFNPDSNPDAILSDAIGLTIAGEGKEFPA